MLLLEPHLLAIYTLAAASITRLITTDTLLERPRDAIVAKLGHALQGLPAKRDAIITRLDDRPRTLGRTVATIVRVAFSIARFLAWAIAEIITCPWCAGFWVSLSVVAIYPYWDTTSILIPAVALGMRLVAGVLIDR
jgi:hypothetical protein